MGRARAFLTCNSPPHRGLQWAALKPDASPLFPLLRPNILFSSSSLSSVIDIVSDSAHLKVGKISKGRCCLVFLSNIGQLMYVYIRVIEINPHLLTWIFTRTAALLHCGSSESFISSWSWRTFRCRCSQECFLNSCIPPLLFRRVTYAWNSVLVLCSLAFEGQEIYNGSQDRLQTNYSFKWQSGKATFVWRRSIKIPWRRQNLHSSSFTEENHTRQSCINTAGAAVGGINNNQGIYW